MTDIKNIIRNHRRRFESLVSRWLGGEYLSVSEYGELRRLYQKQPEWLRLRDAVGIRCGNICENCEKAPYEECHHLHYKNYFREKQEDLLGVCRFCHKELTLEQKLVKSKKHIKLKGKKMTRKSEQPALFTKCVRAIAKLENFYLFSLYKESPDYEKSKFITVARWTGLVNLERDNKYRVTLQMKQLAEKSDEMIMQFSDYFLNHLSKIPKDKNLESDHALFMRDSNGNYLRLGRSNKILTKSRRYHPDFFNLFKIVGISHPDSIDNEEINNYPLPIVETKKEIESKPTEISPEKKTSLRSEDEIINRAFDIKKLMTRGIDMEEAIAVADIVDRLKQRQLVGEPQS